MNAELKVERLALEGGGGVSLLIAPALDGTSDSRALVEGVALAGLTQLSLTSCKQREHGLVHLRYNVSRG